jgi:hypothetical protein
MNPHDDSSAWTLSPQKVLTLAFAEHDFTQTPDGTQLHVHTTEPSIDVDGTTYIDVTVINCDDDNAESVDYRYRIQHQPD